MGGGGPAEFFNFKQSKSEFFHKLRLVIFLK